MNAARIKKGDMVTLLTTLLNGCHGIVIAVSPRTGGLTVKLTETCGCYQSGSRVNVMPYEVSRTA